nr:26S proteasome non-ATPase regulatory subunit 1 homolog A-like [Ipomoea batatas]
MLVERLRLLSQMMRQLMWILGWRAIVERMLDKCIVDGKYQQAIGMAIECRRLDKVAEAIVLRLLVDVYQKSASPNYLSICQWLMFLDKPNDAAAILEKLLRSDNRNDALMAFQIAFELLESENQVFLLSVRDQLSSPKLQPSAPVQSSSTDPGTAQTGNTDAHEDAQMMDDSQVPSRDVSIVDPKEATYAERLAKIKGILSGETAIQLTLQFLYSHNK